MKTILQANLDYFSTEFTPVGLSYVCKLLVDQIRQTTNEDILAGLRAELEIVDNVRKYLRGYEDFEIVEF
jgi:hypothetical protein